jgi:hypothetical protein
MAIPAIIGVRLVPDPLTECPLRDEEAGDEEDVDAEEDVVVEAVP